VGIARQNTIVLGRFRLDAETESIWRDAMEIRLRPKAFAVLRYLAERPRRLVTKDELLEAVWPDVAVGEAALAVCASLCVAARHFQHAARILGAAEAFRETIGATTAGPEGHRLLETTVVKTRDALGDQAFDEAFAEGRRLSVDEAMSLGAHPRDVIARRRRRSPSRSTGNRRNRAARFSP
jgi:hypothetical protein